jgi:hypothetical protein
LTTAGGAEETGLFLPHKEAGMARRLVVPSALVLAAAVFAGSALAGKPDRSPAGGPPSLEFPAGVVCPFAVKAEALENRQTVTVFDNGKTQFTGFFLTGVTNLANGKSVELVSGGPVRITDAGGGLINLQTSGPLVFFFFPGDAGPGDVSTGRTYYIRGNTHVLVDPVTSAFHAFDYSGNARDICAELA